MDDLIRRSDAERALTILGAQLSEKHTRTVAKCVCAIKDVPSVDAEPVRHGRWEWHETWSDETPEAPLELLDDGWACSECGVYLMLYLQSHFPDIPSYAECASDEMPTVERCPHCGAKMDGGIDDGK